MKKFLKRYVFFVFLFAAAVLWASPCDPDVPGDIAGSGGLGDYDCVVNLYDLAGMAFLWQECTDPEDTNCMGGNASLVNVKTDLVKWHIFYSDAKGDGQTDDSRSIQAAINHLATKGGGTVYLPAGTYVASGLQLANNVILDGDGIDQTIFRAARTEPGIILTGSNSVIRDFTYYGSMEENSGVNWDPNTNIGVLASHNISVRDANDCEIRNVKSLESRYDTLYLRGVSGLGVHNSHFNRAGRNIISIVDAQNWTIEDTYIGNLWCLYHVDMEHTGEDAVIQNGLFDRCTFDGVNAGSVPGTDTWGRMVQYIVKGTLENITISNSTFDEIQIRVDNGYALNSNFNNNVIETGGGAIFRSEKTEVPAGFENAIVSGNVFRANGSPATVLQSGGVSFTNSSFTNNDPSTWDN